MFEPTDSSAAELRIGLALSREGRLTLRPTARADGPTRGRLEVFCDALSLALETKVTGMDFESYEDLLLELHWGTLALAWLPPLLALRAVARGSAVPLVVPVRGEGAWYWSALFTRQGSAITSLDSLDRARVAWVDPLSSSGYLVVAAALREKGLSLAEAFGEQQFLGTHEAVVSAVLEGRADVGATYAHFDDAGRVRTAGWGRAQVRALEFAGPIPGDVLAAGTALPDEVRVQVTEVLTAAGHGELQRAARELLNASGFEAVSRAHFARLEALLAHLELGSKS